MGMRVMKEGPPGNLAAPHLPPKLGAATDLPEGAEGIVIGLYGTAVVAAEIDVTRFGACRHPRGRGRAQGPEASMPQIKVAYGT